MLKKDHEMIAEDLRIELYKIEQRAGLLSLQMVAMEGFNAAVDVLIQALKRDNSDFDISKFIEILRRR